jgi:hypothetical protein
MTEQPDSEEYRNFTSLLRGIVTVPHAEIKRRMEDDEAAKDWSKANHQGGKRRRPIVSPAAVSASKTRP